MTLSLTDQFLAQLQAKFGTSISNPGSLMMGGSVVSESTLKAAATTSGSVAGAAGAGAGGSGGGAAALQAAMAGPSAVGGFMGVADKFKSPPPVNLQLAKDQIANTQAQLNATQANINLSTLKISGSPYATSTNYNAAVKSWTDAEAAAAAANNKLGLALQEQEKYGSLDPSSNISGLSVAAQDAARLRSSVEQQLSVIKPNYTEADVQSVLANNPNFELIQTNIKTLQENVATAEAQLSQAQAEANKLYPVAVKDYRELPAGLRADVNPDTLQTDNQRAVDQVAGAQEKYDQALVDEQSAVLKVQQDNLDAQLAALKKPQSKGLIGKVKDYWNNLPYWAEGVVASGAAAVTGFLAYESLKALVNNPKSIGGWLGTVASLGGLIKSLRVLNAMDPNNGFFGHVLNFMTNPWGIAMIVGALVLFAVLGMSKNTDPSTAELPVVNMPTVWTSMPAYLMTLGTVLAGAGISLGPQAPLLQTVTIPTVQLASVINSAGLQDGNGNAVASAGLTGSVFYSQGAGSGGTDQVVYVTPGSTGMSVAHVFTLKPGLKFASPNSPQNAYINFISGPTVNGDAVQGLQASAALSTAAGRLANAQGVTAQQLSGAANKTTSATGSSGITLQAPTKTSLGH